MTVAATHAKPCAHIKYRMTCDEFDRLRDDVGDICQICGVSGPDTPHGALHIDHDASVGEWAVRGLLCSRCNTQLDSHVHVLDGNQVARYLSQPWHRARLEELGLPSGPVAEPPVGAAVRTRQGRVWRRVEEGWVQTNVHGRVLWKATWGTLRWRHGPFLRAHPPGELGAPGEQRGAERMTSTDTR